MTLIGREGEQKLFATLMGSPRAEMVAVYGRRRVGKTFLVRDYFKNKGLYFEVTGVKDGTTEEQLLVFKEAFQIAIAHEPAEIARSVKFLKVICLFPNADEVNRRPGYSACCKRPPALR